MRALTHSKSYFMIKAITSIISKTKTNIIIENFRHPILTKIKLNQGI